MLSLKALSGPEKKTFFLAKIHFVRGGGQVMEAPFLKCVVSIWASSVRGGCKGLQGCFGVLFSLVAWGCKGLPGWFGELFFHGCPFDKGGGEV